MPKLFSLLLLLALPGIFPGGAWGYIGGVPPSGSVGHTQLATDSASLTKVSAGKVSIDANGAVLISTGGSGNNDRSLYVSSSNWVIIGGTSPILSYVSAITAPIGVGGGLMIVSTGATRNGLTIASESNAVLLSLISNSNPAIDFYKSTGTLQNQQGIGAGASIMLMRARPIQSSGAQAALGQIQMKTSASGVTTGSYPSDIEISVTKPNSSAQTVSYIGTSSGAWGIGFTSEASVSPTEKLDVNGGADIRGQFSVVAGSMTINHTTPQIKLFDSTGAGSPQIVLGVDAAGFNSTLATTAGLTFGLTSPLSTGAMNLDSSGNLAISGTSAIGLQINRLGPVGVYSTTKANISTITPVRVGELVVCTDCTIAGDLCISTGTALAQFKAVFNSLVNTAVPGVPVVKGCGVGN